ncbi:MAG TPA: FAD-linked oxidase C-terminal domain-containing protein, partial [Gemmatimonadaceae bacterium]|nr:FAD-linked oxidase C-terminal domain-containing protein [Gemmatimonadaceae bacterium]
EKLGAYLRDLIALIQRYDYAFTLFGHFGQGCIHSRIAFNTRTPEGVAAYRSFMEEASDLVVSYGGSLSGEHGDGQARGELLPKMFGPEVTNAFREFKSIWDPAWKMNPGKIADPYPLDSNLRVGPDYHPLPVLTHFQFPDDNGSLARATERCFGVGKCRRLDEGTMCPSFMVLREEKHTTRGRAHLLFEMLRSETITDGWKSEAVKESLDYCLCCKGCKGDCPVNVDMATYKAEFLSHYYEGRLRPRSAYAFGLIHRWSRLAERAPAVANFLTQTPGLDRAAKWMAGMAHTRKIPAYASRTFRRWWEERPASPGHGPTDPSAPRRRVLLWPDTFNNYFHPSTLQAGAEVLEHAGCDVAVPMQRLCCGRPLYDFGMLDRAERQLREILDALRPDIRAGTPLVGLEPSCVAVFRDELVNLLPNDEDAQRLRGQTFTLDEFLMDRVDGYQPPRLSGTAVVHAHCHHRAIMKFETEPRLLGAMGLDVHVLDSGCCGMAGSFGLERGRKYDVAMGAGERVLLPAVRNATRDTLVITDGFSCREQIAQSTDRRALHTAEVLQMALHRELMAEDREHSPPERLHERLQPSALARPASPLVGAAAATAVLALGGVAAYALAAAFGNGWHRG